jgi:hypothetical protein
LQDCIEFHHEPTLAQAHHVDVATIHIANSVAVLAEIGSDDPLDAPPLAPEALRAAKCNPEHLPELVTATQAAAAEILPMLLAA